jgi:type II secretory pathway pseudopilin PulG
LRFTRSFQENSPRRRCSRTSAFTLVEVLVMSTVIAVFLGLVMYLMTGSFRIIEKTSEYSETIHRLNLLMEYLKTDLATLGDRFEVANNVALSKPGFKSIDEETRVLLTLQKILAAGEKKPVFHEITYLYDKKGMVVTRTDEDTKKSVAMDFSGSEKANFAMKVVQIKQGLFYISISAFNIEIQSQVYSPNLMP